MEVTEKTKAAYAMLGFGGDNAMLGGMNVRGNIGVRIVRTDIDSVGNVGFPQASIFAPVLNRPCGTPLPPGDVVNPACFLTPEIQTPSFDGSADSPNIIRDGAGNITGYNFTFRAESGFAGLKPILADQFDLTFEHYAGSTSFHADIFYKKLRNTVAYGEFERLFTNNGSEQTVLMRGPRNVKDGGELYGLETGFQTFFDFLPGLLSGLGAQANYTHVRQSGISNSNLVTQGALDGGGTGGFGAGLDVSGGRGVVMDSHRLAGISKHTFNLVGLYEKGPVAFRVAYNWRSRFLTNNLDCCIGLPVFQKSVGFLDASLRISPTPTVPISSLSIRVMS